MVLCECSMQVPHRNNGTVTPHTYVKPRNRIRGITKLNLLKHTTLGYRISFQLQLLTHIHNILTMGLRSPKHTYERATHPYGGRDTPVVDTDLHHMACHTPVCLARGRH
ncbi:hypothetical protein EPI10_002113 [Gossypium australe]|uniref:Uncharacterized protein n=1 Tax=Gossypium australe TaxID=47621 RepID=A0A5B6VDL4_9ROSI|nr:hypothetical protein EPI10_002113 [Gossypium australe]